MVDYKDFERPETASDPRRSLIEAHPGSPLGHKHGDQRNGNTLCLHLYCLKDRRTRSRDLLLHQLEEVVDPHARGKTRRCTT